MTDEQIHDLLERAVRGHRPHASEPGAAVTAKLRRRRRAQLAVAATATLVVAFGTATVLGALGPGGSVQPAGPGERTLTSESELDNGSTVYISPEGSITLWDDQLVQTPEGWTSLPAAGAARIQRDSYVCPERPNVVYRATVMAADGTKIPCIGTTVTPYLWQLQGMTPAAGAVLDQNVAANGTVQWVVQLAADPEGATTYAVLFPGLDQTVVARGVDRTTLLGMLHPPAAEPAPFAVPDGPRLVVVQRSDQSLTTLNAEQGAAFLDALGGETRDSAACDRDTQTSQFTLNPPDGGDATFYFLAPVEGCLTLVSSDGGLRRPSPELVTLLESYSRTT